MIRSEVDVWFTGTIHTNTVLVEASGPWTGNTLTLFWIKPLVRGQATREAVLVTGNGERADPFDSAGPHRNLA